MDDIPALGTEGRATLAWPATSVSHQRPCTPLVTVVSAHYLPQTKHLRSATPSSPSHLQSPSKALQVSCALSAAPSPPSPSHLQPLTASSKEPSIDRSAANHLRRSAAPGSARSAASMPPPAPLPRRVACTVCPAASMRQMIWLAIYPVAPAEWQAGECGKLCSLDME